MKKPQLIHKLLALASCLAVLLLVFGGLSSNVSANQLKDRSLELSSATASLTSIYNFTFNIVTSSNLGSIRFQFCSNDAIVTDSCTAPAGFSDSSATLTSQSGQTGFSISGLSTSNTLIITRTPSASIAGQANYVFSNITNPSSPGAYFVRIETFASNDASGSYIDYGGIAFSINTAINISATVPPYLLFCTGLSIPNNNCNNASGDFLDFGNLSPNLTASGSSQMLAASNAANGYAISVYGTTMESGNNLISGLTTQDVSRPGVSQFGLNLVANSSPVGGQNPSGPGSGQPTSKYGTPNFFAFNSGDVVASTAGPDLDRLYTDDYMVNVSAAQPAGVYNTTLTYLCVATF